MIITSKTRPLSSAFLKRSDSHRDAAKGDNTIQILMIVKKSDDVRLQLHHRRFVEELNLIILLY